MPDFKFTRDDRVFLRECGIDPEPTTMDDIHDILTRPGQHSPPVFYLSATVARDVIREYGELNWNTYQAYRTGRSNGNTHKDK